MKKTVKLLGVDKMVKNLNKEVAAIEGRTLKGMILAAIIIRRSMETTSPKIPIDLGNLRASFFIMTTEGELKDVEFKGPESSKLAADHSSLVSSVKAVIAGTGYPVLIMGFSANYAVFVHENMEARFYRPDAPKGKKGRPGSGPKFFEAAIQRNKKGTLEIIAKHAKIK